MSRCGRTSSECGALCLLSICRNDFAEVCEMRGCDSFFIPLGESELLKSTINCSVYSSGDRHEELYVLLVIGDEHLQDYSSLISEKQLNLIGTFEVSNSAPIIRICDAREAHYVPKSSSREMVRYAALKAQCSEETINSGEFSSWDLCEPLHSMSKSFRLEFWTGLDPTPMIAAFEAVGLVGWTTEGMSRGHWTMPATTSAELIQAHYTLFQQIKTNNNFRCGFDVKCDHLIYDILQARLEGSDHGGTVYPTNTGDAIAIDATNDVWAIDMLRPGVAYVIRSLTETERNEW